MRREDFDFHCGKSEYEDVLQCNNAPSSRTPRGHQTPSAFLVMSSGLDKVCFPMQAFYFLKILLQISYQDVSEELYILSWHIYWRCTRLLMLHKIKVVSITQLWLRKKFSLWTWLIVFLWLEHFDIVYYNWVGELFCVSCWRTQISFSLLS